VRTIIGVRNARVEAANPLLAALHSRTIVLDVLANSGSMICPRFVQSGEQSDILYRAAIASCWCGTLDPESQIETAIAPLSLSGSFSEDYSAYLS
jgi:hypothetical protein